MPDYLHPMYGYSDTKGRKRVEGLGVSSSRESEMDGKRNRRKTERDPGNVSGNQPITWSS